MARLALLSVSDKRGVVEFARALVAKHGFTLLSTGGTAKLLAAEGLPVTEVSEHTGFPEIMEGRVKTLHPKIHGGLLCRRDSPEHLQQAEQNAIGLIELVVVNLYPFEQTVARLDCTFAEAIENIDIGGPSMLRSAAKNHASVTVVADPADYARVLAGLDAGEGSEALSRLRRELALKVFQRTGAYDQAIAGYLAQAEAASGDEPDLDALSGFPRAFQLQPTPPLEKVLRYGENPHQQAALYGRFFEMFEQLQGKELSYCNLLDISSAAYLIGEFERPTLAILKHTNPCGAASADTLAEAWDQAFATDRQAPFGGIIVVNRTLDGETARRIGEVWCEIVIAPRFSDEARALFEKKKNLRLMVAQGSPGAESLQEVRSIFGGYLVQDRDRRSAPEGDWRVVTARSPSEEEWTAMRFGWKVVKHLKSNAVLYAGPERTLGMGAGQMSRVDSSRIAVRKAEEADLSLKGSVMASDALIPFPDGLEAAAEAGATACIQTGGSVRDEAVIEAANRHGMAMVFTGYRHFRH